MPLSYNQYVGDGTTKTFNLGFDYIDKSHVEVRVDGTPVSFTWLSTYQVQTTTAPANGAIVDVRRVTPRDELLVEFMDGSVLVETDLNLATIQSFFLAQEAFDQGEASLAVTPDGHYSAGLRRITMVLDPVNDRDVVTKGWVLNTNNTSVAQGIAARDAAIAAKNAAETARSGAETARAGAETAKTAAEAAKTAAETARAGAETAKADAETAKSNAANSASAAASSAASAEAAKDAAEAAQSAAEDAADRAEQAAAGVEYPVSYAPQTLNSSEQAQARANIGVVLQSSATDTTAGRVLTVGAFGIGAQCIGVETDLNNYNVPGSYITPSSGVTNLPAGWPQGRHILIVSGGTSYTLQIIAKAGGGNTGQFAYRIYNGTSWGGWKNIGDPMPVGSTYIQMPGEATPSSLFGGTWSLLFNNEGIFFRTEGGNALSFGGGIQADEIKSHTHSGSTNSAGAHTHNSGVSTGSGTGSEVTAFQRSNYRSSNPVTTGSSGAHSHTLSINATGGAETRPRNRTVRVWKRTA